MKDALGYYQILEVSPSDDAESIKNAYRNKAKIWHPDSNTSPEAVDVFRKLSEAYEVLSNDSSRRRYNILSLCCNSNNYPSNTNLSIIKDGQEDVNLRVLAQKVIRADFIHYHCQTVSSAVTYKSAVSSSFKNALVNWCLGWWHIKAFFPNLRNIIANFIHPINSSDSCRILLINMLAHEQNGQSEKAAKCGLLACDYLNSDEQKIVRDYINGLKVALARPRPWNILRLRLVQMFMPVLIFIGVMLFGIVPGLMSSSSKEINYYQNVNLGSGKQFTDDLVVGKIINIPVNKKDLSKLYHLKQNASIMYGPSDKFDVLLKAPKNMTVRLTGISPDNVWARVMIDNGEMGFIRFNQIEKGRGAESPFGSAVVE